MRKSVFIVTLMIVIAMITSMFIIACGGGGGGGGSAKLGITADSDGDTVTIFNTSNFDVVGTVPLSGSNPWGVTLSADGETAYVFNRNSDNISIVSMSQAAEIGTIGSVGSAPRNGIIGPDGYLYVVTEDDPMLYKVLVDDPSPSVVDTLALGGSGGYAGLALSNDNNYLYVGEFSGAVLDKVELATFTLTDTFDPGTGYIWDMVIDSDGIMYLGDYDLYEILTWDTNSDTAGSVIPLGVAEVANGLFVENGKLYISNGLSYNTDYDGGALTIVDTDLRWDDYDYGQDDDGSYVVSLPFTFNFQGTDYTEAVFNSNGAVSFDQGDGNAGYVEYDVDIADVYGFSPVRDDLSSSSGYFNYSHRTYADRVVFQWATSVYEYEDVSAQGVVVNEVVLHDDGSVRFDYLFSMPDASDEIDTSVGPVPYGVGDESGTALVDLEAIHGSPFDLTRRSFLWDPDVSETSMPEVSFQWEGSGALHLPVEYNPRDIAVTENYIFLPCPHPGYREKQDNGIVSNVVVVYDKTTLLPETTITVGNGPRAIAIQP